LALHNSVYSELIILWAVLNSYIYIEREMKGILKLFRLIVDIYYTTFFKTTFMQDLRLSQLWRFKSRSSGLWHYVMLW